jgi:magnesium transporter
VGIVLAAVFIPIGIVAWGDAEVIVAVGLALFAACSTATLVAMALPALIKRLGADPAFGSGPLATVIQDLLSILIYFAIVSAIVGS